MPFDQKKPEPHHDHWDTPTEPFVGVTPAVGGEAHPVPQPKPGGPFDFQEAPQAPEWEWGTGNADDRIKWLKKHLSEPIGPKQGVADMPTPGDVVIGAGQGAIVTPSSGLPSQDDDPKPTPRVPPGEQEGEEKAAKKRIEQENLQSGIKKLMKGKDEKDEKAR